MGAFANDKRILAWDIWNEPDNLNTSSCGKLEPARDWWANPYTDREPAVWHHEIFRTDGTPYREDELGFIAP